MIWFLGDIMNEINAVDLSTSEAPSNPIARGRPLGVLPDDLKRLWVVTHRAYNKLELIENETIDPCEPTEDGPDHFTRKFRAEIKHQTLVTCFHQSIRESMPEAAAMNISAIALGWQVITTSPEHPMQYPGFNQACDPTPLDEIILTEEEKVLLDPAFVDESISKAMEAVRESNGNPQAGE
ncbi:MAG: hypothetical protein JWN50_578 [Parcubacteria group bacterium]|nr:hypothetical protein [Parcubacteria group bacterium]